MMDRSEPQVSTNSSQLNTESSAARRLLGATGNFLRDHKNEAVATLAAATLTLSLSACGTNAGAEAPAPAVTSNSEVTSEPAPTEPSSAETTAPANEIEAKFNEAKAEYEAFVATLTPEQLAVKEQLSPENLAPMSSEEMRTAFAIPISEVADENGQIDPEKYAASATIRQQASDLGPCTDAIYSKHGGALNMLASDGLLIEATRYTNNAANAMIGVNGTVDTGILARCLSVEVVKNLDEQANVKPYELVEYVMPGSVTFDAESGNISFGAFFGDNYDAKALAEYSGLTTDVQLLRNDTVYQQGLHVNEEGNVVPAL